MEFEFLDTRNGEKTVKINSLFLHSSYNPTAEAQRFVQSLSIPFIPKKIVIIEPGLSYCLSFFKESFPKAKIGVIKLTDKLPQPQSFDFEIDYLNHQADFSSYLSSKFTEQELFSTFFVTWPASSKIFEKENASVWNAIKSATENAKTLLITREYFEKKWLLNSCNLLKHINKTVQGTLDISKPVIICASGPSLKDNLKTIQKYQENFFIIALSSALSVLLKNKIKPDLVMSTDGGFWAGEHLKKLKNQTLALPLEAYCPKGLLEKNTVLPLIYSDGISSLLKAYTSIDFYTAKRNGTVSGTALDFALDNTKQKLYFFGLDLAIQKEYQHTQPNELEINNSLKDNRIKTKERRLFPGSLKNASLSIYEEWFKNQPYEENRIFRIIDDKYKKNSLGKIKDISSAAFEELCQNLNPKESYISNKTYYKSTKERTPETINKECKSSYAFLYSILQKEEYQEQLFPLSFVLLSHLQNQSEQYNLQKEKINKEVQKLLTRLEKILNG